MEFERQIDLLTVVANVPQGASPMGFFSDMKGAKGKSKGKRKSKSNDQPQQKREVTDYPKNFRLLVKIRATELYEDRWNPLFSHTQEVMLQEIAHVLHLNLNCSMQN